jgi:hypothetical protein
MLSFSSVGDVIIIHGVNVITFLKAWILSFSSEGDVIFFEFLDVTFLIVEDVF